MNKYFHLTSHNSLRGKYRPIEEIWDGVFEFTPCPMREGHSICRRIGNYKVKLNRKIYTDILWSWYSTCFIQNHVYKFFLDCGFTGFDVRPVEILDKHKIKNAPIPIIHELVVTGWVGDTKKESGITLERYCEGCGYSRFTGVTDITQLIDDDHVGDNDFFFVWPLIKFIFVKKHVTDVISKHKISGAFFVPMDKIQFSFMPGFAPGRPPAGKFHQRFKYDENGMMTNWRDYLDDPWGPLKIPDELKEQYQAIENRLKDRLSKSGNSDPSSDS